MLTKAPETLALQLAQQAKYQQKVLPAEPTRHERVHGSAGQVERD